MRAENAIDFWRGLALVMIYINHIPGTVYSNLTLRSYSISDAAELFVFLAGCSMSFVLGSPERRSSVMTIVSKLLRRAYDLWMAQIVVMSLAIAMLGAAALWVNDPLLLEWHNAGPAFYDTVRSSVGIVLLTYQIGYFNILPMYVVLLLVAPVFLLLARQNRRLALGCSVALYLYVLVVGIPLPSWPTEGAWFFNPLSWQLLMVIGLIGTDLVRNNQNARDWIVRAFPVGAALVLIGAFITQLEYRPDPMTVPEPRMLFLFDKMYLSPIRILNMVALAVTFYGAFAYIAPRVPLLAGYLCRLGRNSLAVFAVLSLLALLSQIIRYLIDGGFLLDTALVVSGILILGLVAWLGEFDSGRAARSQPQ